MARSVVRNSVRNSRRQAYPHQGSSTLPRANLVVHIKNYPFVDRIGKHDGPAQLMQYAEVVAGTVTLYHPGITGAETIASSGGDAPVSVVAGGIVIGVGKAWSIKDSAGHFWTHCAAISATSVVMWDVSGLGDHLVATGLSESEATALCSTGRDPLTGTDWRNLDGYPMDTIALPHMRAVCVGDSYTANGTYVDLLASQPEFDAAINRGVQGATVSAMETRILSELQCYCGDNVFSNGEFTENIDGWTRSSSSGTIEWTGGKLKIANTESGNNCACYSQKIIVSPNTTYEFAVSWSDEGGLTSLNTWIGTSGVPFNNSVMTTKSVIRPFKQSFTTGPSVTNIYIGFMNSGGVVGTYALVDSISIRPSAECNSLVLQGGINDINTKGSITQLKASVQSVVNAASGKNIVICNVGPYLAMAEYKRNLVDEYNNWLRDYCTANGLAYVDIYSAMVSPSVPQMLNPIYDSGDGLHPNTNGYLRIGVLILMVARDLFGVAVRERGPCRNNITQLSGTSTTIDPAGTYEFADTNGWRVVTGWTAGTANDFHDVNGVPIPFTGQQAIDAGVGPRLYCGSKGIAGYTVDQDAPTNAKIIKILKVPTYIDTLYWADYQEFNWEPTSGE